MFLEHSGWVKGRPVGQDSSIRRYFRVSKGKEKAILMETVPDHSPYATPGHRISDFVKISNWLNEIGLNAPEIYDIDEENGYLLLEDFGDTNFKKIMHGAEKSKAAYVLAARVLEHLSTQDCPLELPNYYDSHVHKRHRRVVDWYLPLVRDQKNKEGLIEEYRAVWEEIEQSLPAQRQGFLHIDFHAENLMWVPDETGLKRCGILDFQGAMIGPAPYDLANLLEDARNDVPENIRARILSRFDEELLAWYRILGTQFHCRVIGQFIKQAAIDENTSYLPHIGRLQNYLKVGLRSPVLAPLKTWFDEQGVNFEEEIDFSRLNGLRDLVDPSAQ